MNVYALKIVKILPVLTLTFTILVFCFTVCIDNANGSFVIFILMSLEVYVNWIAIYLISYTNTDNDAKDSRITNSVPHKNSVILDMNPVTLPTAYGGRRDNYKRWETVSKSNMNQGISSQNIDIRKIWYCSKCHTNTPFSCHHCPLCNRCIIYRDHHCLFLGTCICFKNMCHFIILCMYVGLVSIYVNIRLFPLLYEHFQKQEEGTITLWHLSSRCFFPVALGRWLSSQEDLLFLSLVAMFDVLVSTSVFTLGFGMYHLYLALTGQSQIRLKGGIDNRNSYSKGKVSFRDFQINFAVMFGKWGALNFIFPIVLLKKVLHLKYFQRESKYN
ncbi:putative ZDHHC-type palmitoyltransferase 4 [Zootermopsis nevadensis]|uniref:putative ZDHHC-type palmitoyltransferase 4 n=1 Tax=Zootermopsis nevadensis TaxID=136037 RepID=UPI000B8E3961|nr:putative ZDHHC-type palmitoyltransferase 4 [Zootermopsis nevadensis]XP_021938666.1 putative ZDHHC-type palmitoyltransferase 4 [Zootermopsis nevadensis]